jgi:hypothetical protein
MLGIPFVVAFLGPVKNWFESALFKVAHSFLDNLADTFGKLAARDVPPKLAIVDVRHCLFLLA